MRIIRSKALNLFPAIIVHIYGLIATIVACMYIWQLFLTEVKGILKPLSAKGPSAKIENWRKEV